MKVIVIPARYGSTRFPGKLLYPIKGVPLIIWVLRKALKSTVSDLVVVATDDERIKKVVEKEGIKVFLTPSDLPSGTDRIAYVVREFGHNWEYIVNLQGDEPLIDPRDIDRIFIELEKGERMVSLKARIEDKEEVENPNVVKVVTTLDGYALYFSRSPIPYIRGEKVGYYRHIGIYGYERGTLLKITSLDQTPLERAELLEQLRALENGIPIKLLETENISWGVDSLEDVGKVEKLLEVDA